MLQDKELLDTLEPESQRILKRRLASDEQVEQGIQQAPEKVFIQDTPKITITEALQRIENWWSREGKTQAAEYRQRLYPSIDLNLSIDQDSGKYDRSAWLTLFALGAFQSLGRTKEEQHRGFIKLCQDRGWWEVFTAANPQDRSEQWMDVIEAYADRQIDDEQWAIWFGHFPKIYRFSRWLDDYVELFLSIDRFDKPFALDTLLTPRSNLHYQGGGLDAPPLLGTFNKGAPLVIRELLHHQIIKNSHAARHAYAPITRTTDFLEGLGSDRIQSSQDIYKLLRAHLGDKKARFNGDFDIPIRLIAGNPDLQEEVLGCHITMDSYV